MAYAALHSLVHTIKGFLEYSPPETTLLSALHHAESLRSTLEKCSQLGGAVDEQMMIIEAAIKLDDAIDFSLDLNHDIHCFVQAAKEIKQIIEGLWEQKAAKKIEEYIEELFVQKPDEEEDVEMVGICDQFLQIRDKVLAAHEEPESNHIWDRVIWISGMAGVGKTALANKVFHDPLVKAKFRHRAYIRMGLTFWSAERCLQAIRDQLHLGNTRMPPNFLLFLDDVWDPDFIYNLHFGTRLGKQKGTAILFTSRTDSIFSPYFSVKVRFMNEEESWELLRRKVFGGEEYCPPQLVKPGKKIAEKCEGLPLLINAVAPILLSKAQKDPECWNRVAQKPDSVLEEASHQISQVLLTSYYQIPEDEKLCFLYIASFPLSCVVPRSTIINLWLVEGFKYNSWTYNGLISNNLVVNNQESWSEAEAFSLHCSYWYVSKRVAMNNKFLCVIKSFEDDLDESIKSHRRLAIQENVLLAIKEVYNKIASITNVRSLLCNGPYNQYEVPICWEWQLLKVLRVLSVRFYEFPVEVVKLIRLKYLALTCNANLPPSISNLSNLEFLIVHQHLNVKRVGARSYLPVEIWLLELLVHLEIPGRNLPDPPPDECLYNLEGLFDVGVESCTKEVLESLPRLEKLRTQIELAPDATQTLSFFDHIPSFFYLESFQSVVVNSTLSSPPPPLLNFGSRLKKLSLSGFGYPWEDMSKIAEMSNLKELRLECYAFRGEKWEAKKLRFSNLKRLLIEDTDLVQWTAKNNNFPRLCNLTMRNCYKLREIPILIVDVELVDCNPLAEACIKQWYHVKYSWKEKVKDIRLVVCQKLDVLGLWEIDVRDLKMVSKLDFDEEATVMLKKVESNVKKILELRQQYENLQRERRLKQMQDAEAASVFKDGDIIGIHSASELKLILNAASKISRLSILYFTATWCGPCRYISPILMSLAAKYRGVVFLKVDIDGASDAAAVSSVLCFFFVKKGVKVDKVVGADKNALEKKIAHHA